MGATLEVNDQRVGKAPRLAFRCRVGQQAAANAIATRRIDAEVSAESDAPSHFRREQIDCVTDQPNHLLTTRISRRNDEEGLAVGGRHPRSSETGRQIRRAKNILPMLGNERTRHARRPWRYGNRCGGEFARLSFPVFEKSDCIEGCGWSCGTQPVAAAGVQNEVMGDAVGSAGVVRRVCSHP